MTVISVVDLTKEYGDVTANDDVSFAVSEGEVFGYLGPNGAGKTTTIRTLMGFQSPTSGNATVLGADITDESALIEARRRIGYLPASPSFDEQATGEAILDLHASIKGDEKRTELLERFTVPVEREIRGYSTGQFQKLGLVQAFMHDPDLVILDEPTAGLDPLVQRRFNDFIRSEKAAGTTIFLSSHVLSEVRRVCDRIGIIRNGAIAAVESVEDLLQRAGKFVRARIGESLTPADVTLDGVHELSVQSVESVGGIPPAEHGEEAARSAEHGEEAARSAEHGEEAARSAEQASASNVTELTFTYTGDFDSLVSYLDGFHVQELDVEEAPLEKVFMRFYDDGRGDGTQDGSDGVPDDRPDDASAASTGEAPSGPAVAERAAGGGSGTDETDTGGDT